MPPLGSNVVDPAGVALLTDWILNELPDRRNYDQWRAAEFQSGTSPQGEATADPDGDGANNQAEFLAGTDPRSGSSLPRSSVELDGGQVSFTLDLPANRSAVIEHSDDLLQWHPWDIPYNQGLPWPGGPRTFTAPKPGNAAFFRATVDEK